MTFRDWLFRLCETESPDHTIIAYHFGLFERENGFAIYLIGSSEFKIDDEDWAIRNDFEPADKYFMLSESRYEGLSSELALQAITEELSNFTKTENFRNSYFASAKAITAAFDTGDLILIK